MKRRQKTEEVKNGLTEECFHHCACIFIGPGSLLIYLCFMTALPCGLQLASSWLVILQGRGDQAPWCMRSGHLFTGIFTSALAQVHCFDFSMALQYWFWRELVSSVLLEICPVWFLRDLFSFLLHNFILTCHSWYNWHCTISNWQDAVLKAGEESNAEQALAKSSVRKGVVGLSAAWKRPGSCECPLWVILSESCSVEIKKGFAQTKGKERWQCTARRKGRKR